MQEIDMKISNIFKEKKKENNRVLLKENTKDIFYDENENKNLISLLNKKRKISKSKDKNLNQNNNIKKFNNNSKIKNNSKINSKNKKNNILGNIINIKEDEKLNFNKNNIFELSERTKTILEKITAKKNSEKEKEKNKISNLYNIDYNLTSKTVNQKIQNKKTSPPKLSLKTLEVIKQLNEKRKNRFDRESNTEKLYNSRTSFSTLHLKYDELISEKRELRLPIKYKELLNSFNHLEHIINLNKIKSPNQLNTFENIKTGIESMTHHSFNMNIFKQILYVVPHFYIIKYIKKNEMKTFKLNDDVINKNYDLVIELPFDYEKRMEKHYDKDFNFLNINYYKEEDKNFLSCKSPLSVVNMQKRKDIFRNILNLIVNNYHTKYLQKNKINVKFNPLQQKTWYHKFDPDSECEDIPLFSIPEPTPQSTIFETTIMKNDLKQEIMKEEISSVDNSNVNKEDSNIKGNKYVSQNFLNKIRAKERANSVLNEIHNYNLYQHSIKDMSKVYKEIMIQTKTILMTNTKNNKLKDIAEMVLNSSKLIKDNVNDLGKLLEIIKKLGNKYSEIIKIMNHSYLGPVIVLVNKDAKIPEKIEL